MIEAELSNAIAMLRPLKIDQNNTRGKQCSTFMCGHGAGGSSTYV